MSLRIGGRRTAWRRAGEMIEIDPLMPARPTILVAEADRFSPQAVARLERVGRVELADLDRPGLLAGVAEADVLWVRLRHRVDDEVLAAGPRLRVVVTPTTGLDHLDLEAAELRGVRVVALRG